MKGLTKKQEKKFDQIYAGSLILYSTLDFQMWEMISDENIYRLQQMRIERASKILRGLPSFSSTDEIVEYVRNHF